MRRLAFILLTLAGPAVAGDFRALDIGASCATATVVEESLGNKRIKWGANEGDTVLAFQASAFGRPIVLNYFCPRGVLFAGNYFLPVQSLADAALSYESVHKELSETYGAPFVDNSPWVKPARDSKWIETDARKYMTTWNTPRVSVTMSVMPSLESEAPGWRIFIVYGGPIGGERSNTSLERTRER
jgi:hypothetical protein